jgi:hypothetical protein
MTKPVHTRAEATELLTKGLKGCGKCRETMPLASFSDDPRTKSGKQSSCRACIAANTKLWIQANPEKHSASTARWQKANPENMRANNRRAAAKRRLGEGAEPHRPGPAPVAPDLREENAALRARNDDLQAIIAAMMAD